MSNKRIMIAGTNSGCGKTTLTCALIKAFKNQGLNVSSFKTGPDYVDPMFHNQILNSPCTNLDMFLQSEEVLKHLLIKNTQTSDIAIIEGVMGYYDGIGGITSHASSYDLAQFTKTPTLLVVNGSGISLSLNAIIKGYLEYKENNIVGIIINNISPMFYQTIKPVIEKECHIEVVGYLQKDKSLELKHRHLGLLMPNEVNDLNTKIDKLANLVSESVDLKRILELSETTPLTSTFEYLDYPYKTRIGLVKDDAFCFYYQDNLDLLKKMNVELVEFSLLDDEKVPNNIDGLIIGGGYLELYIDKLSNNHSMIKSMQDIVKTKIPIFAEGAGFVYLCKQLTVNETIYPLTNVIDTCASLTSKLQPFGYLSNTPLQSNFMLQDSANAHEFHYIKTDLEYQALQGQKPLSKRMWQTGYVNDHIFAGFSHYHFYNNLKMIENFLNKALEYKEKENK